MSLCQQPDFLKTEQQQNIVQEGLVVDLVAVHLPYSQSCPGNSEVSRDSILDVFSWAPGPEGSRVIEDRVSPTHGICFINLCVPVL